MSFTVRAALVSVALLLCTPAVAQETPSDPSEIVVTGAREREQQVRDFVTALTPAPSGSIARFIEDVCPVVVGLAPAQNEAVAARLRAVAEAAGLRVARPGCAANAFVIVTADKREFIETLARRRPQSFETLSPSQIRRLAQSPGPAAAWQLEGLVDEDGIPLYVDPELGALRNNGFASASRIRTPTRSAFDAAALVVESGALDGLTTIQLADYAAMRLFAKVDPARLPATAPPTILNVLTTPMGSPVPITMTNWDLAFLRGLYGSAPDLQVSGQRSEIGRLVNRELNSAAEDERD